MSLLYFFLQLGFLVAHCEIHYDIVLQVCSDKELAYADLGNEEWPCVNETGGDSDNTTYIEISCCTLRGTLTAAQVLQENVTIIFNNSHLNFKEGFILRNMRNFVMRGVGDQSIHIECNQTGGLAFIGGSNISITTSNMLFNKCGYAFEEGWPVALLFREIENVSLSYFVLYASRGTAVALVECYGTNTISQLLFSQAKIEKEAALNHPGGGALHVSASGVHSPHVVTTVAIQQCAFTSNKFSQHIKSSRGGGLAVLLTGNVSNYHVFLYETYMTGNLAVLGAGMFFLIADDACNNSVTISEAFLYGHNCFNSADHHHSMVSTSKPKCIGGAINIQFRLIFDSKSAANNTIMLNLSRISKNIAYAGGAISVSATHQQTDIARTNKFILSCNFEFNRAQVGSSLHLSAVGGGIGYLASVVIMNSSISTSFITNDTNVIIGEAAVYTNRLPLYFNGSKIDIYKCSGTAVVASNARITVVAGSFLNFTKNDGKLGGALSLLNNAMLHVENNAVLYFNNNSATEKGGAIYISNYYDNYAVPLSVQQCAIHIVDWQESQIQFVFHNNHANKQRNAIFATSIISCAEDSAHINETTGPFCWSNWIYENSSCDAEVVTSPATIKLLQRKIVVRPGFQFPIPMQLIDDYGKDISDQSVVTAFVSDEKAIIDSNSQYIASGNTTLYGVPNSTVVLGIATSEPRVIYTKLAVEVDLCPPGYTTMEYRMAQTCICIEDSRLTNVVLCNKDTSSAKILFEWCMTYDNMSASLLIGQWMFYSQLHHPRDNGYYKLPTSVSQLDDFFCSPLNRMGRLCSSCTQGTGVPVYSYDFRCIECREEGMYVRILLYLLAELVPVTIFFLLIILFNISITKGPAISYVFFSQLVTIPTIVLHLKDHINALLTDPTSQTVLLNAVVLPYSMWNLDFFRNLLPPFCLSSNLSTIHVVAMSYISALYPLLLIIIFYMMIELYASNFRPVVFLFWPLSQCLSRLRNNWRIRTSFVDAFATFLVLSYAKLCSVSILLLVPNMVYGSSSADVTVLYLDASIEYNSPKHRIFMLPALLVLCVVIIPLPLILLLYPLQITQKCLNVTRCLHRRHALAAFMDAFQGCYKNGVDPGTKDCRWFSAVYFFMRIVILTIILKSSDAMVENLLKIIVSIALVSTLVVIQPYKNRWYTVLDVLMFNVYLLMSAFELLQSVSYTQDKVLMSFFFVIVLLPAIYMTVSVVCRIVWHFRHCFTSASPRLSMLTNSSTFVVNDSLPDRMVHPNEYAVEDTIKLAHINGGDSDDDDIEADSARPLLNGN